MIGDHRQANAFLPTAPAIPQQSGFPAPAWAESGFVLHRDQRQLGADWEFSMVAPYPALIMEVKSAVVHAHGMLDGKRFVKDVRSATLTVLGRGSHLQGVARGNGRHQILILTMTPDVCCHFPEYRVVDLHPRASLHNPTLQRLGDRLWRAVLHPEPLSVESLCCTISDALLRTYGYSKTAHLQHRVALRPSHIRRLVECMEDAPGTDISVQRLAAMCGLSTNYFVTAFRECFGVTPYQYMLRKRITRGKRLLANSRFSVSEVAEQTGFCHTSHFSSCFHAAVGVTPLAYRRMSSRVR